MNWVIHCLVDLWIMWSCDHVIMWWYGQWVDSSQSVLPVKISTWTLLELWKGGREGEMMAKCDTWHITLLCAERPRKMAPASCPLCTLVMWLLEDIASCECSLHLFRFTSGPDRHDSNEVLNFRHYFWKRKTDKSILCFLCQWCLHIYHVVNLWVFYLFYGCLYRSRIL